MVKPTMSTEFFEVEIQQLSALIGSRFHFFGGIDLPDFLMAAQLVISTSEHDLVFEGDIAVSDFQGYAENYSKITVRPASTSELTNLIAAGNVYSEHSGTVIRNVYVVRRLITELKNGSPSWLLSTSRAVVLDLGSTQLCISKLGEHDEALAITNMSGFNISKVPDTSNYFEAGPGIAYQVSDETISISV
jgi:hypothetical protein